MGGPETEKPKEQVYTFVEQMPEFPGGQSALLAYLQKTSDTPTMHGNKAYRAKCSCLLWWMKRGG